jgi:signal peptidase II
MELRKENKVSYYFILAVFMILLDQITKQWLRNYFGVINTPTGFSLYNYENIPVIGDFLQFTYVENEGMAFGISFGAGKIFLSLFSIIASIGLSWYLIKIRNYSTWIKLGIAFILAGAAGNLIDRVFYGVIFDYAPIFYGRVIDFVQIDIPDINLGFLNYSHFPVFNVADSCVTVGVVILILFHKKLPTLDEVKEQNKISESENSRENNGTD